MEVKFSARESFSKAIGLTKDNWYIFSAFCLVSLAINFIPFVGSLIFVFASLGLVNMYLGLLDGKKPSLDAFVMSASKWFNVFMVYIIYALMLFVGFILFIIPGVFLLIRFMFVIYYVIDSDMTITDVFKASWNDTKGNFWHLLLASLSLTLFAMAGLLLLIVGVLYTVPIAGVAMAIIYRTVAGKQHGQSVDDNALGEECYNKKEA